MRRVILGGLLAATAATSGSVLAAGTGAPGDDTGAWYLSPMAQYSLLDRGRVSRDDFGYQIGVGKNLAPNWAAEFNYSNGSFKIPHSGASQKLSGYSVDALYKFLPNSMFRPYLLAGAGLMDDTVGRSDTYHTFLAEAGAGLLTGIGSQTGSTRVQLRTEAKYRLEFANRGVYGPKDPSDLLFGVGLQFMFGAPTPPMAVAPPPPPPAASPPPPPAPPDSDGDGVPDSIDQCPNTPKGDTVDSVGCTIKDEIKLKGVNFATDSANITPESSSMLDYGVATLKKYPHMVIEVDGHTDSRGSKQHNLVLSQHRAESVMNYLQEHGVTNTMTAKGFGEDKPIADNTTADGRLENRRVSLHIVGGP